MPPALEAVAGWAWRLVVVALAAYACVQVLSELRLVVVPLAVALLLAALLAGPAARLRAAGAPPALAAATVVGGALAVTGGLAALIVPAVAGQFDDVADRVEQGVGRVADWAADLGVGGDEAADVGEAAMRALRENGGDLAGGALGGAVVALEVTVGVVLTLFFLFFLLKDGARMWTALVGWLPHAWRGHAGALGERWWTALRSYVRSQVVVAAVDAVAIAVALWLIGVPLVVPLGVFTFFACFVPIAGAWTAGIAAALVALVTVGPEAMALVALATVVVHQVEGNLLQPLIMGRMLALHPMLILASVTAGTILAGVVGAALAVPVAAVVVVAAGYMRDNAGSVPAAPAGR